LAAIENASLGRDRDETNEMKAPQWRTQVTAVQPFYIPAKVPEEIQVHTRPVPSDDTISIDTAMEAILEDFDFKTDNGIWISAHAIAHESRTSLSTTTTASTLIDDRYSHGSLTIDTSFVNSAPSTISSAADSIPSAASADIYGWEEELDRQTSMEGRTAWEQVVAPRLSSGGRMGPHIRGGCYESQYKRGGEGRTRSLLYRVLNISGRRGSAVTGIGMPPMSPSPSVAYQTRSGWLLPT
jgi:hypothetical protein